MVFRVFTFYFFCLETAIKTDTWMRTISVTLKVLSQQLPGALTTTFEIYFTVEDFTDMDHHMLILSWVNMK